jgi:hypothetical protein
VPELTTECRSLIEGRNVAYLGTIRSDGSAAMTPVWVDLADDHVVVNGAGGRAWTRHLLADPRGTVCVTSLLIPYHRSTDGSGQGLDPPSVRASWRQPVVVNFAGQ